MEVEALFIRRLRRHSEADSEHSFCIPRGEAGRCLEVPWSPVDQVPTVAVLELFR